MRAEICQQTYLRAIREDLSSGVVSGKRPETTLDDARNELAGAISKVSTVLFQEKYGPFLGVVSQPAVNEFLKVLESNLACAKGDITIVLEEIFDRIMYNNTKKQN